MEEFLNNYIESLIECSNDKYQIDEYNMRDVVSRIRENEHIWCALDNAIYEEIEEYRIEEYGDDE